MHEKFYLKKHQNDEKIIGRLKFCNIDKIK